MRKHIADVLFLSMLIAVSATPGLPGRAYGVTENLIQIMLVLYALVLVLAALKNAVSHALESGRRHKKKERVKKPKRRRHRLR